MLSLSRTDIPATLSLFNSRNLDVVFIVPTETGLKKGILDAIQSVRTYFAAIGYHDYRDQGQGPKAKVIKNAVFLWAGRAQETRVSLYRPETKHGDPRIWVYGLPGYAKPDDLIGLAVLDGLLYVINCSDPELLGTLEQPTSPLGALALAAQQTQPSPAAFELLGKLRRIASRGFVQTLKAGDTGVGYTLESLLGIKANSRKEPDFKGIEIKAFRLGKRPQKRHQLFSRAPNWELSPIRSAKDLVQGYGWPDGTGRLVLNHELNALKPNSRQFMLGIDHARDWLRQEHADGLPPYARTHLLTWELQVLREALIAKHATTFWVAADSRGAGADELFRYVSVTHTERPKVWQFDSLLEAGAISVDLLLSQLPSGRVRDHGYLFKILTAQLPALLPTVGKHSLVDG